MIILNSSWKFLGILRPAGINEELFLAISTPSMPRLDDPRR